MLSTVPEEILDYCKELIGAPTAFKPASGGCINHGGVIESSTTRAFIKWNSAVKYPKMFEAEAKGLELLQQPKSLLVPKVLGTYNGTKYAGLLLEVIEEGSRTGSFWEEFGRGLADLHTQSNDQYGLDHNNYMGSLNQANDQRDSWLAFFVDCRLDPQIELAKKERKIDAYGLKLFDQLKKKLPELLAEEQPALVHGDLWSGNFMVGPNGEPTLIDPAVAFSHRETDLAMTQLFGGFNSGFYRAYQEVSPLEPGFEARFEIYNLYPLLVHVNLFGGGYYQQVLSILNRYV